MKKSIVPHLPLMSIAVTVAITGIQVFQTGEDNLPGMQTAELIFVILLAILFGLGILVSARRAKSISKGMPVDDELSRFALRVSAATTFFISLLIWLTIMVLNAHTDFEPKYLTGIGIMFMCLIFIVVWASKSMIRNDEEQD